MSMKNENEGTTMIITNTCQISFELELVLGDLSLEQLPCHHDDRTDIASEAYCRQVALSLADRSGRPWESAVESMTSPGYWVCPAPDIDPQGWPKEAVAAITLCTPPLSVDAAQNVRQVISEWARSVGGCLNEDIGELSCECSWLIRIHSDRAASISVLGLVTAVDELERLIAMDRHSSGMASPQRHEFGPALLRHLADGNAMKILTKDIPSFLIDNSSRDCRSAIGLDRLAENIIELRHFASWAFFHEESLLSLVGEFVAAASLKSEEIEKASHHTLEKFRVLSRWFRSVDRLLEAKVAEPLLGLPPLTEITYAGYPAGAMLWDGTARLILRTERETESPKIFRQSLVDWKEALAVLALDIAEIRAAGLESIPIENEKLSFEIDRLAQTLKNHGLLGTALNLGHDVLSL